MMPAKILTWVALVAALGLTAQAEWELAQAVGWWIGVAWLAPVSLDSYVIAAFRAGRDRTYALGLMSAAVFASHSVSVAFPNGMPWWVAGVCSVLPPIVAWRIHELWRSGNPVAPSATPEDASAGDESRTPAEAQNPAPAPPPADDAAPERATPKPAPAKPRATRPRPRKDVTTVADMTMAEQIEWVADELANGASTRALADWERITGWSPRTVDRRLASGKDALAKRHNAAGGGPTGERHDVASGEPSGEVANGATGEPGESEREAELA